MEDKGGKSSLVGQRTQKGFNKGNEQAELEKTVGIKKVKGGWLRRMIIDHLINRDAANDSIIETQLSRDQMRRMIELDADRKLEEEDDD